MGLIGIDHNVSREYLQSLFVAVRLSLEQSPTERWRTQDILLRKQRKKAVAVQQPTAEQDYIRTRDSKEASEQLKPF